MPKVQFYALSLALSAALAAGLPIATVGPNASAQTPQAPQQATSHRALFGTITSVSAGELSVTGRSGKPVTVKVAPDTRILERAPSHLADIRAGDRVEIVAQKGQDGSLTALSVLDSPADLARGESGRSGTRQLRSGKVLVRGPVVSVGGTSLSVAAGSGSATNVTVPETARVQRLTALPASSLSAGMRVVVRGTGNPDGSVTAAVVIVASGKTQ